ncbi:Arc-like DNA binding domain protein [Escherichia coli ACN001]|nr:Arc-like DNA binding domain protein [Escherichia coli ACN001]
MLLCFLLLICLANKKMSEKDESNFIERFTVRMPDGMRSAIAERAKRNGRSMNSEIVQILEDALSYDVSSVDKSLDLKQIKSLLDKISNELLDRIPKDT